MNAPKTADNFPAPWTYLTNHAHVLILLARDPHATMRKVAGAVGVTERAVQRIVAELEEADVLERSRSGRRNVYKVKADRPLRHPVESHCSVSDLLELVNGFSPRSSEQPEPRRE